MILAVTGITGHSGGFLLQQLIDNRFDGTLRCLVRASSDTAALDTSGLRVEKIVGSTKEPEDLYRLVQGADTVLHISGIWETPALLRQIERAGGVKHVVLVHTSGVYSKHKMASQVYKDIEADMQQFLDRGMNVTILRPTMIFGDLRDHNISKFIRMVDRFPVMPQIDGGRAPVQPVNARDLGQAYYKAAMREKLPELCYICSGERPVSVRELCALIGQYLGKRTRFVSVPMGVGVAGAKVLKAVTGGKKDLVEKVLRLGEDRSFSHEAAYRDFGYEPEPFEIGLKREVEEYLAHGRT
ncbi:MAG: NAD(P)H-binding protein [Oscillospiraceae bacterium]|nr:NAD(P)H-binding protein [Oscillospiraceae bacterium]